MIDKIKKHCFLAVGLALAYLGWGSAQLPADEGGLDSGSSPLPELSADDILLRKGGSGLSVPSDPFHLLDFLAKKAAMDQEDGGNSEAPVEAPAEPEDDGAQRTIMLQSTMRGPSGYVAYINGRLMRAGQRIEGLATSEAPEIIRIAGTEVEIRYGGQDFQMDIEFTPRLKISRGQLIPALPTAANEQEAGTDDPSRETENADG